LLRRYAPRNDGFKTRPHTSCHRPAWPGDPVFQRRLWQNREAAAYWIPRWSLSSGSPKARPGGGVWRPFM